MDNRKKEAEINKIKEKMKKFVLEKNGEFQNSSPKKC